MTDAELRSEQVTRRLQRHAVAHNPLEGEDRPTAAKAMVPMLDWPTDLFNTFTAEVG